MKQSRRLKLMLKKLGQSLALGLLFGCAGGILSPLKEPETIPEELKNQYQKMVEIRELLPTPTEAPARGKKAPQFTKVKKEKPRPSPSKDVFQFPSRRTDLDPFKVGEKASYELTWMGIPAGYGVFEVLPFKVLNDRKVYHIKATAVSSAAVNLIYRVDDAIETFFDYEGLFAHRFEMHLNESKQVRQSIELFDHHKKESFYWDRRDQKGKGYSDNKMTVPIDRWTQDSLSSLYYLRMQPQLEPGMVIKFPVVAQKKTWIAEMHVLRRETIKTDIGTVSTVVIKPEMRFHGVIEKKGDSYIWLTDDDRRLMVRLEAQIKVGSVLGQIKKIE